MHSEEIEWIADIELVGACMWEQVGKIGLLERVEIPTKIKLLPEPWTPETGLVTAAMNIMREAIRKHFADDLNELYHQQVHI